MASLMAAGGGQSLTSQLVQARVCLWISSTEQDLIPLKGYLVLPSATRSFSPVKALEEVAELNVMKSSHVCLLVWRGNSSLGNMSKEKRARWSCLGNRLVLDETEEGVRPSRLDLLALGADRLTVMESSFHLCPYLPLGHLQEALEQPAGMNKSLSVCLVVFSLF